jgi:hypothetical protein
MLKWQAEVSHYGAGTSEAVGSKEWAPLERRQDQQSNHNARFVKTEAQSRQDNRLCA